ncbi:AAA family ATPase [candidate division WOR-3 bacterium]|nr:AAA family ATPase [candidate division WOR-3 bacterium]
MFILFDEIQKVSDWQNKLKIYYDLHPDWKFIITGSSGLEIAKRGTKVLLEGFFSSL